MIRLYDYWRSSAAYRVRIGLNLLKLPFECVSVDLTAGEQTLPENLARNPQGLVPTIEIDGIRLTQSVAILEYLDDTRDAGFLPMDAAGRARVRALSHAIAMDIHPVCNLSVARHAVEHSNGGITMEGWMRAFIGPRLAAFDTMLDTPATGRFCHGDRVSMADICLVPQVYNAHRWGVDISGLARLAAVVANLEELPAFAAAHPDRFKP